MVHPARALAFNVLLAVERGGYASDLLFAQSAAFDSRDAGLANQIVFGVLRYRAQLDHLIHHYSGKPAAALDLEVALALRMAIHQIRYLDRIPSHAAVGESVELVKRARKRSAAGFVNAVLRKVNREPVDWPDRAVELSHPEWMLERWEKQFGAAAEAIARANLRVPETYIRGGRIQDIGSQSIVPLLRLAPGHAFLDLCAAPGNKTAQALETAGLHAVACDLHFSRARELKSLGIPIVVLDAVALPFSRKFDRILVDAPCTGTGTLARNPEIKWRSTYGAIERLRNIQMAILRSALDALAPGGLLVYSTCSLEREENEEVIEGVAPGRIVETMRRLPGRDPGDGFFAAVMAG
jgi:16S rRNA (cytosine967-C5)-methyltransferase